MRADFRRMVTNGKARVYLHVGHAAPRGALQFEMIPIDVLDGGVADPYPPVVAAQISVVVPAVGRLASVHYIPN
jgi:hypothetical protein